MYTVEKIENNIVTLENRTNKEIINININKLPNNVKEKDIIDLVNDEFIINVEKTEEIKQDIRNKFNSLIE